VTLCFTSIRSALAGREISPLRALGTAGIRASLFCSASFAHSGLSTLRSGGSTGVSTLACAASLAALHARPTLHAGATLHSAF